jgi:nucleoside-diphosphate-sugar epimerase
VGRAYHLAACEPVTKDRLLGYFWEFGLRPLERSLRARLAIGAVALAAPLRGRRQAVVRLEAYARRRAQHDCVLDCSRAAADLGWRGAADVRDAVRRTMEYHCRGG